MADIANRTERTLTAEDIGVPGPYGWRRLTVAFIAPGDEVWFSQATESSRLPMTDPRSRYRLWYWSDVARWFADHTGRDIARTDDHVQAAISAGLEMRYHARHLDADRRSGLTELIDR